MHIRRMGVVLGVIWSVASVGSAWAASPEADCWRVVERTFTSDRDYARPLDEVTVNATFTHADGTKLVRPVFWDGQRTWRVRFAPTKPGVWQMQTTSSIDADRGLHGVTAQIDARAYSGDKAVFAHGFLKPSQNRRYFVHADGTPFLWMSEDHAFMDGEAWDQSNRPGTTSQFKHMADTRWKQGFTVYQSVVWTRKGWEKPGVPKLEYYRDLDRKFAYLADLGFVHSTAVGYHKDLGDGVPAPAELQAMKLATRYVQARYGAYPLAFYTCGEFNIPAGEKVDPKRVGKENLYVRDWWAQIATTFHAENAYGHPQSINFWQPLGDWFKDEPFMTFWCLQAYSLRDHKYYRYFYDLAPTRPIIDPFSGMDRGRPRSQEAQRGIAYVVMQSGGAGWGFLVEGIWNNCYTKDSGNSVDTWGGTPWFTTIEWQGATYMTHAVQFYKSLKWWEMIPRNGETEWAKLDDDLRSPITADGKGTVIVYFYGRGGGTLGKSAVTGGQVARWYDPRTGTYRDIGAVAPAADGTWTIPGRPDGKDWVLLVQKR